MATTIAGTGVIKKQMAGPKTNTGLATTTAARMAGTMDITRSGMNLLMLPQTTKRLKASPMATTNAGTGVIKKQMAGPKTNTGLATTTAA